MIKNSKIQSRNFDQAFHEMEDQYIDELTEMLMSKLIAEKSVQLHGNINEKLEFAGRTNYKIRLRVPNKNVWSISFRDFRESIRKVLREGTFVSSDDLNGRPDKQIAFDMATNLLLHVLPDEEYAVRSFVGNSVKHPTLGDGKVKSISESGNVEVEFEDRVARLKPKYIQLKKSEK